MGPASLSGLTASDCSSVASATRPCRCSSSCTGDLPGITRPAVASLRAFRPGSRRAVRPSRLRPQRRTPPVGDLPVAALQPDLLADDVAALIRHYGAARADVLGFSYGGGIAMRMMEQHPELVRSLILASATAYQDYARELEVSRDYQARSPMCARIAWDDPELTA